MSGVSVIQLAIVDYGTHRVDLEWGVNMADLQVVSVVVISPLGICVQTRHAMRSHGSLA